MCHNRPNSSSRGGLRKTLRNCTSLLPIRRAEEKERREIKEADEHCEPNPWLHRVGWAAHLAGIDRGEIREWVEMPDKDEPELETAVLFEVLRKEVTEEARMPFDSQMEIATVRSNTQICRQLLCYVFRVEEEKPEDRPAYKLTEGQKISMRGLQAIIQEFQGWKNEQPSVVSGEEGEGAVMDQGEEGELAKGNGIMKRSSVEGERAVTDQGEEGSLRRKLHL
ncbi:hypothetical protein V499_00179 [Pseudogymnoascus sp. VKM F-103]|nr:hypothetical protein V499_00179 [Pseudogymnoascus sp. VKM F-103]